MEESIIAPFYSDNTTEFILGHMKSSPSPLMVLEYGTGCSTIYYLRKLIESDVSCDFVGIEMNKSWFIEVIEMIKKEFSGKISDEDVNLTDWSTAKYIKYILAKGNPSVDIPLEYQRLPRGKRLAGKHLVRKILGRSNNFSDGYFTCKLGNINFTYTLRSEMFKDQIGESPFKEEYINSALALVKQRAEKEKALSIISIVDGGPRHDVVSRVMDIEENYSNINLKIFLLDVHKAFYLPVLERREKGTFRAGTNNMLNNKPLHHEPKGYEREQDNLFWYGTTKPTLAKLKEKELWFYENS